MPDPNQQNASQQDASQQDAASGSNSESYFTEPVDIDEPERPDVPQDSSGQFAGTYDSDPNDRPDHSEGAQTQPQAGDGAPQDGSATPQTPQNTPASDPSGQADPDSNATSEDEGDAGTDEPFQTSEDDAGAPDAQSDEQGDPDAATSGDEDDVFYDNGESVYRSKEEALRGIDEKDQYIGQLEEQIEQVQEESTGQVEELQGTVQQLQEKLELYQEQVPEGQVEELAIQELLPEDYRGKSANDFTDDAELQEFYNARAEAKAEYRQKQRQRQKEIEDQKDAIKAAQEQAKEFVEDNATADFFGASAPEQRAKLKALEKPREGEEYSDLQQAQFITSALGRRAGRLFLEGLRASEFNFAGGASQGGSDDEPAPQGNQGTSQNTSRSESREKQTQTKVTHRQPTPPPKHETPPMDDREEAKHAFKQNVQNQNVNTQF